MAEAAGNAGPAGNATDAAVAGCVTALRERFGATLAAVVLYGSFLRGKRDTVLDFYVLLDSYAAVPGGALAGFANRLLPPNVYFLTHLDAGRATSAKYATVTLADFERAIARDFHPYFWARFAQPCVVVYARDEDTAARIAAAGRIAGQRVLAAALPLLPTVFTAATAWRSAFSLTYGCELRAENRARTDELFTHYRAHLEQLFASLAPSLALERLDAEHWRASPLGSVRARARAAWALRRVIGKLLAVARLAKAAFTFDDPLGYILWKVERHTGVRVEATARQRRHPLLFAWGVLWRVYCQGGFR